MNNRKGICNECNKHSVLVKYLPSTGHLCAKCNSKRLSKNKSHKQEGKASNRGTGEAVMFECIWNTRKKVSFVSGEPLGAVAFSWYFAHVLPKSTYPQFRLFDKNIVLLTLDEHTAWDQRSRDKLRGDPKWDKMFQLEQELKEMYNSINFSEV